MNVFKDQQVLRNYIKTHQRNGHVIGLIPTMGNLHEGHLTLVDAAQAVCDVVLATIFVNPLQFGPNEDFENYPRTLDPDLELLSKRGANGVYVPSTEDLYPNGLDQETLVKVPIVSEGLCGSHRPDHFDGVSTIVTKLFNLCQPDKAFFGEKDFQQLMVIKKMAQDLCTGIEIIGVPTVRAHDGLALSSRNGYLSSEERSVAPKLYETLSKAADQISVPHSDVKEIIGLAYAQLNSLGFKVDYLEVRQASNLAVPSEATYENREAGNDQELVILAAAYLGKARLIDNIRLTLKSTED